MNGLGIASSSGKIVFRCVENNEEIMDGISNLITTKKQMQTVIEKTGSNADELKKYKELLDMGAITSEEYEVKKKELLK